jgi:hypothetical protein
MSNIQQPDPSRNREGETDLQVLPGNEHMDTATQAAWNYLKNQWDEAYEFGYQPAREATP